MRLRRHAEIDIPQRRDGYIARMVSLAQAPGPENDWWQICSHVSILHRSFPTGLISLNSLASDAEAALSEVTLHSRSGSVGS